MPVPGARAAEPVRIEYSAPSGCPDHTVFEERVRDRSAALALAEDGELAWLFTVTLVNEPGGALGRLEFMDEEGTRVSRTVAGETCDEVVSSLALITALALDARQEPARRELPRRPPPSPPPEKAVESAEEASPNLSSTERPKPRAFGTGGIGGGYVGWAGPSGALALDAFFDWAFAERGPKLRLSAWHWRATGSSDGREAAFLGWGGRIEACPLSLSLGRAFLEPCAGSNLGLFRGEGRDSADVAHGERATIFWRDVLLVGRVGTSVGRLVFEAQGEVEFPLVRRDFGFTAANGAPEGDIVFSIPAVSGGAEIHAAIRFP